VKFRGIFGKVKVLKWVIITRVQDKFQVTLQSLKTILIGLVFIK